LQEKLDFNLLTQYGLPMRQARMKVPEDRENGYYHCVSRVVDRQWKFQEAEKDKFVTILREYEAFCGVRVLTYCVMSNHFHVLVEVPKRPAIIPDAEELLKLLGRLSCKVSYEWVRQRLELFQGEEHAQERSEFLESFYSRMWDVSWFMRLVKQRFTQWYNRKHGRKGTLWEERFKSVMVEGAGEALVTMASYIDLNPVRAGIVEDPKDYRWSGYGEATAGGKEARAGLKLIVQAMQRGQEVAEAEALAQYRMRVYLEGDERREGTREDGSPMRGGLKQEEVAAVLEAKGRLPVSEYVRCRVRYFCDGAIFGSREYVEEMFGAMRERFGPKRKSGARRMKGVEEELFALRNLRLKVVRVPERDEGG